MEHYLGRITLTVRSKCRAPTPTENLRSCFTQKGFFINLFIYLFLAVLGLRFCARAFSSSSKRGPLFIAVRGPLTAAASPIAEHRLQTRRLSSCGSRAQPLCSMWDLPRPGLEPMCLALAGRFSTTAPLGKPPERVLSKPAQTLTYPKKGNLSDYFQHTFIGAQ